MKAKDLMMGDYISVKPSGMPIKIAAVHHKKVAYHAVISKLTWVREGLLEPISLTLEILEKNGFENGKLNISPQYYLEYNNVFIGVTLKDIPDKHKGIDIAKGKLFFQYDISYIEEPMYVHQLQHALRLCEITREIIL